MIAAESVFTYPSDYDEDGVWSGRPSVAYGVVRRIAHHLRVLSGVPNVRLLYGEAGRQGDPWGGLRIEVAGHLYHFGAGIGRYPHLIGPDRVVLPAGELLMAQGMVGKFTYDFADWRWVQLELDLTAMFSPSACQHLSYLYEAFRLGAMPVPIFQSYTWAKRLGIKPDPNHRQCTLIHAKILGAVMGVGLGEYQPLALYHRLESVVHAEQSPLDTILSHWLAHSEGEILIRLAQIEPMIDWKAVAMGKLPVTSWMVNWYLGVLKE